MSEIAQGTPLWHDPLNKKLASKADRVDVIPEIGTVTLTNSLEYPFSSAETTVALQTSRTSLDYQVVVEVVSSSGAVEDIVVSDKQENGFKLDVVGSSTTTVVKYFVTGGFTA